MSKLENWNDVFSFGKFRGKTVKEVFDLNVGYLRWLYYDTSHTYFTQEVKEAINDKLPEDKKIIISPYNR